ncbi:MAG: pyridoxal-phosphate dependent enzyme [Actinomycetota bacterium]
MFDHLRRAGVATLPTPLERGPLLPSGDGGAVRLWCKRDDLTGLGGGGNKARKLDFLVADAVAEGADTLVTVGAAQSNHCRMTAAAGARAGIEVHLVLSGDEPDRATGNQLLSRLFGAQLHFTGVDPRHWGELEIAREQVVDELEHDDRQPYGIQVGGSSPLGAVAYAEAYIELLDQCAAHDVNLDYIVTTSSSGGTHAGLVAGRAIARAAGRATPRVIGIGVAEGVVAGLPDIGELARQALDVLGATEVEVTPDDVVVDGRWLGDGYAIPTESGDRAIQWAAAHGGWLLDRTYSGKGLGAVLAMAADGEFGRGTDDTAGEADEINVAFIHTGGWPALFAPGGVPDDAQVASAS